jgi:hypothetical protein
MTDHLYPSNAEDVNHIHALILSVDVSDMIALITGCNPLKIIWNPEKVTWRGQKKYCQIITAAMKWMLLTTVSLEMTRQSGVR